MKKIIIAFCFLFTTLLYAEININFGLAPSFNSINYENDNYKIDYKGLELQVKPCFTFFPSIESKFGFGINSSLICWFGDPKIEYKDNDYYQFQNVDTIWYNETYIPSDKINFGNLGLSISPTINFRTPFNDSKGFLISLGPAYTLTENEFYLGKKADSVTIHNWQYKEPTTGYPKASVTNKRIYRSIFNIEGQIGIYKNKNKFLQDLSCYFKIGNFEYSEITNNSFAFTPSFSIGLIYRLGFSIDNKKEHQIHIEEERIENEKKALQQQEFLRQQQEEQQRLINEKNKKIQEKFGNYEIVSINTYSINNPYAFESNKIYHYEKVLFVHQWLNPGVIVGTIPKEQTIYITDSQIYLSYIPDKSKINSTISDVYMQYLGVEEFKYTNGAIVVLPKFMVLQCNY